MEEEKERGSLSLPSADMWKSKRERESGRATDNRRIFQSSLWHVHGREREREKERRGEEGENKWRTGHKIHDINA